MQKLADLNSQISKVTSLNIVLYDSINNYTYNNYWVTDLDPSYFDKKIKKLEKLFDKNINYDDENHIKYLQIIYQDVIEKYKEQFSKDYSKLSTFETKNNSNWGYNLDYPKTEPRYNSLDLQLPNPVDLNGGKEEYIIEGVKGFYNIDDEDEPLNFDELILLLKEKHNVEESDLHLIFAKSHLSYIIWLHQQSIIQVLDKIKNLLEVVEKLKVFSESETKSILKTELEEEKIINEFKLIFKCRKYEIAYIFNFLFKYGYIDGSERFRDSEEYIKKFLDENETYYFSRNKLKKVESMTSEFTRIGKHSENHITKEINFSEKYIENLEKRIEDLKSIK